MHPLPLTSQRANERIIADPCGDRGAAGANGRAVSKANSRYAANLPNASFGPTRADGRSGRTAKRNFLEVGKLREMRHLDPGGRSYHDGSVNLLLLETMSRTNSGGPLRYKGADIPADHLFAEQERDEGSRREENAKGDLSLKILVLVSYDQHDTNDGPHKGCKKHGQYS